MSDLSKVNQLTNQILKANWVGLGTLPELYIKAKKVGIKYKRGKPIRLASFYLRFLFF